MKTTKMWGEDNKSWNLFISRYYDCEMCSNRGMTTETLATCHKSWLEHYEFAYCRMHRCETTMEPYTCFIVVHYEGIGMVLEV